MVNTSGRRKEAVARVLLKEGNGSITVNNKPLEQYFPLMWDRLKVNTPIVLSGLEGKLDFKVNVRGGGVSGQAEAVRLSIAKALVDYNQELKPAMRQNGLMTRDARVVERKKPGRSKARRRFQFSKR